MASSQVKIVSAQNFGCVLRDRNQKNDDPLQKNLKSLHHHHLNRIYAESAVSDENSQNRIDYWIENQKKESKDNRLRPSEFQRPIKDGNFSDSSKQTTHKHCLKVSVDLQPRDSIPIGKSSENSRRDENIGASSLVQIWESRLNRSNGGNPPSQDTSTASSSRRSSGVSLQETLCSSPSIDGESEPTDKPEGESKSLNRTAEIESGSCCSVTDSGESKWGRVADIIKQLSDETKQLAAKNGGMKGLPIIRIPSPSVSSFSSLTVSEKSIFPVVACSPRIRGRQAFADLLMKLERDRHRELDSLLERNAVSKFPQRGRLQSMLRLRSLQRCLAIQERHRSNGKTADSNRQETCFTVLHLRERPRAHAANAAEPESSRQLKEGSNLPKASNTERSSPRNHKVEEEILSKNHDTADRAADSKMTCLRPQETRRAEGLKGESENEDNYAIPSATVTSFSSSRTELREGKEHNTLTNALSETPETMSGLRESSLEPRETSSLNEWEEYEDEQSYYRDTNYDWISEVSRPRSYWEDLRKNRYMEVMMNTRSGKADIRRLLERRTVSTFLESGLRESIERLMMCRAQEKPFQRVEEEDEGEKGEVEREEEEEEEEEEVRVEAEEQDSDDSSLLSSPMFSSSPGGSWSPRDTGATSTLLLPIHNYHSAEMEHINELRGQIRQLQREVTDLRDSVKTCIDSTAYLQQSVLRENPLKRKCCVCSEAHVEGLLYRCGHTCTCLKCGNELQWNGGKCPICHAQILDVVRVFVDPRG